MSQPAIFGPELDLHAYLAKQDAVLVPKGYEKYLDAPAAQELDAFSGQVIESHYVMDEGSLLYLEAKIKNLLDEKRI